MSLKYEKIKNNQNEIIKKFNEINDVNKINNDKINNLNISIDNLIKLNQNIYSNNYKLHKEIKIENSNNNINNSEISEIKNLSSCKNKNESKDNLDNIKLKDYNIL